MQNKIELSWTRETEHDGKELQIRAEYQEESDDWRVEMRTRRSDKFSYVDTTRNIWRCFQELAEIHLG